MLGETFTFTEKHSKTKVFNRNCNHKKKKVFWEFVTQSRVKEEQSPLGMGVVCM